MIETRYGLKYSMPHSVVHIVDNSQYNGPLPVVTAEDPSLVASIVVTGAPMGADNKMITINRSDVLNVAYNVKNITSDDIRRYGQAITYPAALINQGGPVRFMRVTPDDATYAVSSLVVQWRIDGTDNKLHVRFRTKDWPVVLQRDRFKNTARVNEALVKYFKNDNVDDDGSIWTQRSFINFIAGGRGSAYNNMVNAINMTIQARRPANVRYEFVTIDSTTNLVNERFFASLVNVNNKERADAIDSVNTVISKRLEGSSITIPYVNDAAVRELYKVYIDHFKNMLDVAEPNEFTSNAYKAMNINIFDMIFGNYIYNGTDTSTKMPFYQVDMFNTDIPEVPEEDRLSVLNNVVNGEYLWDGVHPEVLYNKLLDSTYGVSRSGDAVHVGDLYLSSPSSNGANPRISIVTSINQYTGNVTSMTIPRVFPLSKESGYTELRKNTATGKNSVIISTILDDVVKTGSVATSAKLNKAVIAGTISDGAVVAAYRYEAGVVIPGFELYTVGVENIDDPITGVIYKNITMHLMDFKFYYEMLDRESHSGGVIGTGNAMGFWNSVDEYGIEDAAWNRVGATVVIRDTNINRIYVNSYERTSGDDDTTNRIYVGDAAVNGIIGTPPTTINPTQNLVGSTFDVQVYDNASIDKWKMTGLTIGEGVTGYKVGDQFYIAATADANGITPGSENDPEKYIVNTGDSVYIDWWEHPESGGVRSAFLKTAPSDWDSNYYEYSKYDTTTKRIVPVGTVNYDVLSSEPSEFDPTAYYKKIGEDYVPGESGDVWAENTWYARSVDPAQAPEFTEDLKVLTSEFMSSWNSASEEAKADKVDTTPCHTIITVSSINGSGEITGFNFYKTAEYSNSSTSVLNIISNQMRSESPVKLKGVFISAKSDERILTNQPEFTFENFKVTEEIASPSEIKRFAVTGSDGSLFRVQADTTQVPNNYYSKSYGINPSSEVGGIRMSGGYTGFFDDTDMNEIEFKWRYSALLVRAFRGYIDSRIQSPTRCPAKFMFDAGYNTIVGSTILPDLQYTPADIINASVIFTDDEKDEILYHPEIISGLKYEDIDVKQAMYDLMIYRCYDGIPEDKRPIGPGSGMSLHLDSCYADANTIGLINTSFNKRFDNPNASWDIGGWNDVDTGCAFTFTKQIVDNLIGHIRQNSINKPYTGKYTAISPNSYTSYFPDLDTTEWELREMYYNYGGNVWIMDQNGNLTRRSQRTLVRNAATSDLLQESNMRTLSQLVYLLQNKIDSYLLEYSDDAVIKTLSDEVNNMFSGWVGPLVDALDVSFSRDINVDGGEILICYVNVVFRGLILRVPIIVNVNRRDNNS